MEILTLWLLISVLWYLALHENTDDLNGKKDNSVYMCDIPPYWQEYRDFYGVFMEFSGEKSDRTHTLSTHKIPFGLFRHTLLLQHLLFTDMWSTLEMGLCKVLWASLWSWLNSFWHYWLAQLAILTIRMFLAFRCTWMSDWQSYYNLTAGQCCLCLWRCSPMHSSHRSHIHHTAGSM